MAKRNIGKILIRMKENNATPLALKVMENNLLYNQKTKTRRIKEEERKK